MIAFIKGELIECQLNMAIIQVGGIGYQVNIPLTTSEKLPPLGKEIKLYTQATYREDSQTLYGFMDRESRDFFRMIVDKVSGIGPRIALNLLGSLSLPMLKTSIASGDIGMLSKAQGLGKKTAERIVVELKDKVLPKGVMTQAPVPSTGESSESISTETVEGVGFGSYHDAVSALLTLGYKATDADQAIRKASDEIGKNASTEELIRKALGR
ncbi:MAG: Holliday junction branch migration protein RuvA [Opitutae bacterium]|jgi:Holliday junction DNA helicase RuvA|nr:Holliday junction branch migration protein RuvA [Opitutae bacterium]MBT5916226.1 Holliday junction branch migration protein RuvA [Opitutae bacterium]MBT7405474.1 Holliday junction branch migration protein RuvA [Opitutae bacterium]